MAEKSFDVVVVGELNPDLILTGEDLKPVFGQVEKLISGASLTVGSSAAIFACGAARLGLKVAFVGKIGADDFGRFMLRSLQAYGINTEGVIEDSSLQTGLSVILSRGYDRAILTYPGAIPTLRLADICTEWIQRARHLHLASYFIQDALRPDVPALFERAHQNDMTVSLDTNYDPSERWNGTLSDTLRQTDIFLPNVTECCAIGGNPDLNKALDAVSGMTDTVAVKQGAEGAMLRRGRQVWRTASIPVKVVDTVGSGDSFDAGFIYGFLAGWEPGKMLQMGVVCGSLSTRKAGGTAAQPTLVEASSYL